VPGSPCDWRPRPPRCEAWRSLRASRRGRWQSACPWASTSAVVLSVEAHEPEGPSSRCSVKGLRWCRTQAGLLARDGARIRASEETDVPSDTSGAVRVLECSDSRRVHAVATAASHRLRHASRDLRCAQRHTQEYKALFNRWGCPGETKGPHGAQRPGEAPAGSNAVTPPLPLPAPSAFEAASERRARAPVMGASSWKARTRPPPASGVLSLRRSRTSWNVIAKRKGLRGPAGTHAERRGLRLLHTGVQRSRGAPIEKADEGDPVPQAPAPGELGTWRSDQTVLNAFWMSE